MRWKVSSGPRVRGFIAHPGDRLVRAVSIVVPGPIAGCVCIEWQAKFAQAGDRCGGSLRA